MHTFVWTESFLAGKTQAEFEALVPPSSRMTVAQCKQISAQVGVEIYVFPYLDPLFPERLRKLYRDIGHAMENFDHGLSACGAFLLRGESSPPVIWVRSGYNRYVDPGVFFQVLGNGFYALELGLAEFSLLHRVAGTVWDPDPGADFISAMGSGYGVGLALTATRLQWCAPGVDAEVLAYVVCDGVSGPFSRELCGFFGDHLLRMCQGEGEFKPEKDFRAAPRAFGAVLGKHLHHFAVRQLGLPPLPLNHNGAVIEGFVEAMAQATALFREMGLEVGDDEELEDGEELSTAWDVWGDDIPPYPGLDPETGEIRRVKAFLGAYWDDPVRSGAYRPFLLLIDVVWGWLNAPRTTRAKKVWDDADVNACLFELEQDSDVDDLEGIFEQAYFVAGPERLLVCLEELEEYVCG